MQPQCLIPHTHTCIRDPRYTPIGAFALGLGAAFGFGAARAGAFSAKVDNNKSLAVRDKSFSQKTLVVYLVFGSTQTHSIHLITMSL